MPALRTGNAAIMGGPFSPAAPTASAMIEQAGASPVLPLSYSPGRVPRRTPSPRPRVRFKRRRSALPAIPRTRPGSPLAPPRHGNVEMISQPRYTIQRGQLPFRVFGSAFASGNRSSLSLGFHLPLRLIPAMARAKWIRPVDWLYASRSA